MLPTEPSDTVVMRYFNHISIIIILFLAACDGSKFSSKSNSKGGNPPTDDALPQITLTCPAGESPVTVSTPRKGRYAITGSLCPKGVGNLDITFIVDFSQSMQFPEKFVAKYGPGSDPIENGTCGRLKAAEKVYELIKERAQPEDNVTFTSIPFSDDFVSEKSFGPIDLKDVKANLNADHFCGSIMYTNYAAGLKAAREKLKIEKGRTPIIYFITDGKPLIAKLVNGKTEVDPVTKLTRVDEATAAADGLKEASELLKMSGDLRLYSLLLSKDATAEATALAYLRRISGKEGYVKPVNDAAKLAEEIIKFLIPNLAPNLNETSATLDGKPVRVLTMDPSPVGQNTWQYTTEVVDLQKPTNIFNLKTKTAGGSLEVVNAEIKIP